MLGYPRIGPKRELKRALARYWSGSADAAELHTVAAGLRRDTWRELHAAGLDSVPSSAGIHRTHPRHLIRAPQRNLPALRQRNSPPTAASTGWHRHARLSRTINR